jgi:tRNA(fMet)-specific endonuclease VapC
MYALDTDTLSRLHAGDRRLEDHRERIDPAEVATTVVTRIEILQGRFDFVLKASNGQELLRALVWLTQSEDLLRQIIVLPIDEMAAAQFDRLRQIKKLRRIGRADLLIAAIALARGATVVTRNLRHFSQIPGLRVENWMD